MIKIKRLAAGLCSAVLLCGLMLGLPMRGAWASTVTPPTPALTFQSDLPETAVVQTNGTVTLSVTMNANPDWTYSYKWYKSGSTTPVRTTNDVHDNHNSITLNSSELGMYYVTVAVTGTNVPTPAEVISTTCNVSMAPAVASGSLYITGYTVQDASGAEKQHIGKGEKCQIVVSVRDGRFTAMPTKTDAYGNIANFKITSTESFSTPTLGDIRMTTPRINNGELEYAVVFNDIMYLGGDKNLTFDVVYNDQSVPLVNLSVGISQSMDPSAVSTTKPRVMIKDSNYGGGSVSAGQTFTLSLTSYNTSNVTGISDVTTSISLPSTVTLAGGSNVTLTSNVPAGGTFQDSFSLQVLNTAETGVLNITVDYSFYTSSNSTEVPYEQLTSSQIITIPVVQPDRFSFTSADIPTQIYTGEENSLSVNFVNKGKGTLYNLTAEIDGNLTTPGQSQYLGNLSSGAQGSADFILQCDEPGAVSGTVTIIYEDVNGNEQRRTQNYSVEVLAAQMPDMGDMGIPDMEVPEGGGFPWWGWALGGLGGAGAVTGTVLGVKKHKAKKRAAELAEDEDDEE